MVVSIEKITKNVVLETKKITKNVRASVEKITKNVYTNRKGANKCLEEKLMTSS